MKEALNFALSKSPALKLVLGSFTETILKQGEKLLQNRLLKQGKKVFNKTQEIEKKLIEKGKSLLFERLSKPKLTPKKDILPSQKNPKGSNDNLPKKSVKEDVKSENILEIKPAQNWNEFQQRFRGRFRTQEETVNAWKSYKKKYDIKTQSQLRREKIEINKNKIEKNYQHGLLQNEKGLKEGDVGSFKLLDNLGSKNDNITPHHIPSNSFMKKYGVEENDGISFAIEDLGKGLGRHAKTRTYGGKNNSIKNETPREALARDVKDLRNIYREEKLYTTEIKEGINKVIAENKNKFPNIFDKNSK